MKKLVFKMFKKENITIFPNPATKGKVVNLMLHNTGNYAVQLVNTNDVALHEQEFKVNNKQEINLFNIPSKINRGCYYIKVVNTENNTSYSSTLIVL
ncbi:MAG: T9SS type A sorting domain-containing protein [Chitinophagaceae bacterium]|nr:T9SS type A sorting domain-containing protein [Chitinophagaceae bacterium]